MEKQTAQAAFFEKMRTTDALIDEIRNGLMDRSFEQKLNGGDNVTNWADVGDMTEYERKLTELRDQICKLGEYA